MSLRSECRELLLEGEITDQPPSLGTGFQLGNARDVHVKLVPEKAAGRRVGAGLEGLARVDRKQRQGAHRFAATLRYPIKQLLQVGEVSDTPAGLGTQRIEWQECAPPTPCPACRDPGWSSYQQQPLPPASVAQRAAVVAIPETRRDLEKLGQVGTPFDLGAAHGGELLGPHGPLPDLPVLQLDLIVQRLARLVCWKANHCAAGSVVPGDGHGLAETLP
jgi:hypothetical protein